MGENWKHLPLLLTALLGGCGDQSGTPQPFPLPRPNVQLLRASGAPDSGTSTPVEVVGLPATVPRAGTVTLENRGQIATVQATGAGSFVARVPARPDDQIAIRFETSEPALLRVIKISVQSPPPPGPIPGVPPVSGPAGGLLTVQGRGSPGMDVFVVNMDTGDAAVGRTAPTDGAFTLQVVGAASHTLRVYEDRTPLSGYWELKVP